MVKRVMNGENFGVDAIKQIKKGAAFDHGCAFMKSAVLEYNAVKLHN